jgi:hypothetical protein
MKGADTMNCASCNSEIDTGSNFCPSCGERQERPEEASSQTSRSDDAALLNEGGEEALSRPASKNDLTPGQWGCISLIMFPFLIFLMSTCSGRSGSTDAGGVDEAEVAAYCNMALKKQLVSSASYKPRGPWTFSQSGTEASIVQDYSATNSFNATVDNTYYCRFDTVTKTVLSLQTG